MSELNQDKQRKAEDNWCELMGLEKNDFNRSLAPVIAGEWKSDNQDNWEDKLDSLTERVDAFATEGGTYLGGIEVIKDFIRQNFVSRKEIEKMKKTPEDYPNMPNKYFAEGFCIAWNAAIDAILEK